MLAVLCGLIVVRALGVREFAVYTVAVAVQTTMAILADNGITQSLMARGGAVATDRVRFTSVVHTALGLRRRLEILTVVLGVPVLIVMLRSYGVGWAVCLLGAGAVAATMHGNVTQTVYSTVMFLQLRPIDAQRAAVTAAVLRLVFTIACVVALRNWVAFLWVGAGAWLIQGILTARGAAPELEHARELSPDDRRAMILAFKNQLLNGIYFALQPQITVWILTVFGTAERVAEVGALGRLALVFSLVSAAFGSIGLPRFARYSTPTAVRRGYGLLVGGMVLIGATATGLTALFPHEILLVLGPKYMHLERELVWIVAASAVSLVTAATYLLNTARGWVRGIWVGVPATLVAQVLLAMYVDLSSVRGVIAIQASASAAPLLVNLVIGIRGLRRIPGELAAQAGAVTVHGSR